MTDQTKQPKPFREFPWYTKAITVFLAAALVIGGVGLIVWLLGVIWHAAIGVWS